MKKIAYSIAIATLFTSAAGARAGDMGSNGYMAWDAGATFQQDATLRQSTVPTYTATFKTGVRGDMVVGGNLNDTLFMELEVGFMWNPMDKVGGTSLSSIDQSVDMYSVPVLMNLVYEIPTKSALTPYLGIGAGANVGIMDFKDSGSTYSDTDVAPAFQAEAGLKYALTKWASIGVAYKFYGTLDQRYYLRSIDDHVTLSGNYVHGFYATLTLSF